MPALRRAQPADAADLAQFAERTFRDAFADSNSALDMDLHCAERFGPEVQRREIEDGNCLIMLAEVDGELAGFSQVMLRSSQACVPGERASELFRLYVDSCWHGHGVAQALMDAALTAAMRQASEYLWLGVWEENPRAIAFYRKYGFDVVGDHSFRFGSEMQKDLIMLRKIDSDSSV